MRISLVLVTLLSLVLLSGCGSGEKEPANSREKDVETTPAKPISPPPPVDTAPEKTTPADATSSKTPSEPSEDSESEEVGKKGKQAAQKVNQYPYETLVDAADEPRLTQEYRVCEDALRQNPEDSMERLHKAYILFAAGERLKEQEADQQASRAFRTAFELAQNLVENSPELPSRFHEILANIYYHGACVAAADGNVDSAKAALRQAVMWGWTDTESLRADPDLASVRELPDFDAELESWLQARQQALVEEAQEDLADGQTFPFDFSVTSISDKQLELADLKGQVVIVDLWGTWCPPCLEEVPSFIKLQEQYGEEGLQIIGLNYEQGSDPAANTETVRDFVDDHGINYPCALGTEEIRAQIPQFRGFPTTLFLDRTGTVRLKLTGLHEFAYLEALALALLEEEGPSS
ncbi:MAG: TlpA disulfide reductase family protein [Planctomycetota bacterium]